MKKLIILIILSYSFITAYAEDIICATAWGTDASCFQQYGSQYYAMCDKGCHEASYVEDVTAKECSALGGEMELCTNDVSDAMCSDIKVEVFACCVLPDNKCIPQECGNGVVEGNEECEGRKCTDECTCEEGYHFETGKWCVPD